MVSGGDLNEILGDDEKLGCPRRDRKCLEEFWQTLDDCELRDTLTIGEKFTWHGNRRGQHIWKRLDRFLCNSYFESLFNFVGTLNLDWNFSNHRPIEIKLGFHGSRCLGKRNRPFKFEEYWTKRGDCAEIISKNGIWDGNNVYSSLSSNLYNCFIALSKWGKDINASRKNRIVECKNALKEAYDNIPNVNFDNIHAIEFELDKLLEEEEIYWR